MINAKENERSRMRWPIFQGILPVEKSQILKDVLAGVTLATLAVPEVMGYTRISGTPVITGLFTILLPMALYALLGSSRHLVVGADSATAAVLAAGLVGIAAVGSPEYVAYAGVLTLMVAGMLIVARLAKIGFLTDFLSRTVLIGFLAGVGIEVAITQIPDMLGIQGHGGVIQSVTTDILQMPRTNIYSVLISIAVLIVIFGARKISKEIPVALIAVVSVIILSYTLNFASHGVSVLGTIPSGLPKLGIPNAPVSWSIFQKLLPTAVSMFVIILAQSAATSRAYAARYNETFDENLDIIGLGIANLGAALSGTFVVNGSPTKTEMVDSAGGRTQLAQLTTVFIVLIVILFLTGPLSYMPIAVLAAIVFVIAIELVDIKQMRQILLQRPSEFWIAVLTAGIVVFVGVGEGIILAIVLSLLDHTRRGYRPSNTVLSVDSDGVRNSTPVSSRGQLFPGLIVYRFNHSMYYANCEQFKTEVRELITGALPPISWFCLDLGAVDDVDFSAAEALRETCELLKQRGIRFTLVEVQANVRAELDRYGITKLVGNDYIFGRIHELEPAYKQSTQS
ncbi:MAG: SulP family inorganic anion transporter [Candidatus Bathyarchaeia archaeon]|jgi:high affinity sulfate transporter 1